MKIQILFIAILIALSACNNSEQTENKNDSIKKDTIKVAEKPKETTELLVKTFLGNERRNYYGNIAPDTLEVIWQIKLGSGTTRVGAITKHWSGAGWTGQPLVVKEDSGIFLIQGTYSHNLMKISAKDGKIIWKYKYDDVLKGTGSIWYNSKADSLNRFVIMQGSRFGVKNSSSQKIIPSFRAVSYRTGKELWRMNSKKTKSYSRDVDGSALVINDTAYIGLENGEFTVFNPDYKNVDSLDGILQPKIYSKHMMYEKNDIARHHGNLVTESSPSCLGNRVYITSGSGHVYGYNLTTKKIDWDFKTGADMDGSPVVTDDNCILVALEREYISGKGGVFKLDPSKPADSSCVKWYFPVNNFHFVFWDGGIIGSASTNESYRKKGSKVPHLAAFSAIDKHLYVVDMNKTTGEKVWGPNKKYKYETPKQVFKYQTATSISTPIIVGRKLIAAGYEGIFLFEFDDNLNFKLIKHLKLGSIEATPVVYDGRLYIATRSGFLYCLGRKETKKKEVIAEKSEQKGTKI